MSKELRQRYPINTFKGVAQDELVEFIDTITREARIDELDRLLEPLDSVFASKVDELTIVKRMAKLKSQSPLSNPKDPTNQLNKEQSNDK